jgi:hypothetical protein
MIEVRIDGRGTVRGSEVRQDAEVHAVCGLCGQGCSAVASVGTDLFACKDCLRERLEAMTLGAYLVSTPERLPWGKLTS